MKHSWQRGTLFTERSEWRGRYYVRQNSKRIRKHVTLGPVASMTEGEARLKLLQLIAASKEHTDRIQSLRTTGKATAAIRSEAKGRMGWIAEMAVCTDLLSQGFEAFRPVHGDASCDIIYLNKKSQTVRVEVKFLGSMDNVSRLRNRLHEQLGQFDVLALVTPPNVIRYFSALEVDQILDGSLNLRLTTDRGDVEVVENKLVTCQ